MRQLHLYIYVGVLCLCLVGCHTQRTTTKVSHRLSKVQQVVDKTISAQPVFETLEARKVRIGIEYAGQKVNLNGSMTAITDSIILLSVQPILGIEMIRIELTPQHILIIDKMNRRYVETTYAEVADKIKLPITFDDIQAIFLNRMFVVGTPQTELTTMPFTSRVIEPTQLLSTRNRMLRYTFAIDAHNYTLQSTQVSIGNAQAQAEYVNHALQDNVAFPSTIRLSAEKGKQHTACEITLLKYRFNQHVHIRKVDLIRYTQTTFNELLQK